MPTQSKLSLNDDSLLAAALDGLQRQRDRIDDQIREIRERLGKTSGSARGENKRAATPKASKKRVLSQAARRRISVAQKKRWAEYHKKAATRKSG